MKPTPFIRALLALSSCLALAGVAGGAEDDASWVYVSLNTKKAIACYRLSPGSGSLTPVHEQALAGPGPLAFSRQRLYAVNYAGEAVQVYRMTPGTGALEPISAVKMSGRPEYIAIDGSGRFLMAAIYGKHAIDICPLDDQGHPLPDRLQTIPSGSKPHAILSDRGNRFVYVNCCGGHKIHQYTWNEARSALLPDPVAKFEAGSPRHLWFHPTRNWLYVSREGGGGIAFFCVAEDTGALTQAQGIGTFPKGVNGTGADVKVTPDGRFVYGSNRSHKLRDDTIAGFSIDAVSGEMTAIGHFPTVAGPRAFAIDPTSRCLIVGGTNDNRLVVHGIDRTSGKLSELNAYENAGGPVWVEIIAARPIQVSK